MDRIIDRIIALLTANVKTARGIQQIYNGDVFLIPKNSIPAIIVEAKGTKTQTITNTQDFDIYTIDILVILDARDYMNADMNTVSANQVLRKIMEERISGTSNELKSDTIEKTIRSGLDSDSDYSLRAEIATNYIYNVDREFPTAEAVMTIQILSKIYTR